MLYCISANYTPKAMQAMVKKPDTNRRDAVEKLVKAADGKVVAILRHHGRWSWRDGDRRCRSGCRGSNSGCRSVIRWRL